MAEPEPTDLTLAAYGSLASFAWRHDLDKAQFQAAFEKGLSETDRARLTDTMNKDPEGTIALIDKALDDGTITLRQISENPERLLDIVAPDAPPVTPQAEPEQKVAAEEGQKSEEVPEGNKPEAGSSPDSDNDLSFVPVGMRETVAREMKSQAAEPPEAGQGGKAGAAESDSDPEVEDQPEPPTTGTDNTADPEPAFTEAQEDFIRNIAENSELLTAFSELTGMDAGNMDMSDPGAMFEDLGLTDAHVGKLNDMIASDPDGFTAMIQAAAANEGAAGLFQGDGQEGADILPGAIDYLHGRMESYQGEDGESYFAHLTQQMESVPQAGSWLFEMMDIDALTQLEIMDKGVGGYLTGMFNDASGMMSEMFASLGEIDFSQMFSEIMPMMRELMASVMDGIKGVFDGNAQSALAGTGAGLAAGAGVDGVVAETNPDGTPAPAPEDQKPDETREQEQVAAAENKAGAAAPN